MDNGSFPINIDFVFRLSPTRLLADLTTSNTTGFLYETGTAYRSRVPGFTASFSVLVIYLVMCVRVPNFVCLFGFSIVSSDFSYVYIYIIKHYVFIHKSIILNTLHNGSLTNLKNVYHTVLHCQSELS